MDVQTQEELLRREVATLADDDILALCYAFKARTRRLRLYLDVLRRRAGERAQFASCLICYDLARQGDPSFQREFVLLADTIRALAKDERLVETLVGHDPYLKFIWELCQEALLEMDPLDVEPLAASAAGSTEPAAELSLLADADFQDFGVATDDSTLWRRFDDAVEAYLGGVVGVPVYERGAGFRMQNKRDVDRLEEFLTRLDSLRDLVPPARGFRALALLFYGTQLRSRSLFGTVNVRKQALLREGLKEYLQSTPEVWEIAGVFGPMHASRDAWEKIAEVLIDYLRWLAQAAATGQTQLEEYDPLARLAKGGA